MRHPLENHPITGRPLAGAALAAALLTTLTTLAALAPQPLAAEPSPSFKEHYFAQARQAADLNRYLARPQDAVTPAPNMEPRIVHCDQVAAAWGKLAERGYCTPEVSGASRDWWRQQCPNLEIPAQQPGCRRPNVLIFLVDDMGWGDFGPFGGGAAVGAATPTVDRLAREGLLLTSTYAQPSCSPTRATIHTGQLPIHHGVLDPPMYGSPGGLTPESQPLPQLLKNLGGGYVTEGVGKWHLGNGVKNLPTALGYDEFLGFLNVSDMYSEWRDWHYNPEVAYDLQRTEFMQKNKFNHYQVHAAAPMDLQAPCTNQAEIVIPDQADDPGPNLGDTDPCGNNPGRRLSIADLDQVWADHSEAFIRRQGEIHKANPDAAPWFLYHATRGCHFDNYPLPEFQRLSYARTTYGDCTVEMDFVLARLLNALEESGQDRDTLIFFTSDNGPEQEIAFHAHTPFRGGKGSTWEGGTRVPGIVRWPGMIEPGRRSDGLFDLADLYPTLLSLAGVDYATAAQSNPKLAERYLYGIDQTSFLLDDHGASNRRSVLYWFMTNFAAVRMDEFKAHRVVTLPEGLHRGEIGGFSGVDLTTSYLLMFNLQDDPEEQNNIFIRHLWNNGLFSAEINRFFCTLVDYPPNLPTNPAQEVFYQGQIQELKDHPLKWKEACHGQAELGNGG